MRFYLHGDVAPPANSSLRFPRSLKRVLTPKFSVRGLQPFHDSPMGPDYWQPQFWRALSTQMAKRKLNMWGFHTYPVPKGGTGGHAEPLVWIGTADGYNHTDGSVYPFAGYQTSWYQTQDFWTANTHTTRGNVPGQQSVATETFCCGASLPFDRNCYGSSAQSAICYPSTPLLAARVFDNAAALVRDAFSYGLQTGVEAAVGIEVPMQMPQNLVTEHQPLCSL